MSSCRHNNLIKYLFVLLKLLLSEYKKACKDVGLWVTSDSQRQTLNETVDLHLSYCSDGSYPKDEGSSQEVSQSLFVGESRNRGTNGGQNKYWGIGGVDGKMRTLPRNKYADVYTSFKLYNQKDKLTKAME